MINLKKLNTQGFLTDKKQVDSLKAGASLYGGATLNIETGEIWSNVAGSDHIMINDNKLAIYVPSTYDADKEASESLINNQLELVKDFAFIFNFLPKAYKAKGSYFSTELNKIIYEDIIIVELEKNKVTNNDINNLIILASEIKKNMKQESVTIAIDQAIAFV